MPVKIKETLFFKKLIQLTIIDKIILYGSRARNDADERSDIDIAIVCPQASRDDWLTITDIINNADTLLIIDVVRLDALSDNNPLKRAIDKEGVILYEKQ